MRKTRLDKASREQAVSIFVILLGIVLYGMFQETVTTYSVAGQWGKSRHNSSALSTSVTVTSKEKITVAAAAASPIPINIKQDDRYFEVARNDVALYYAIALGVQNGDDYYGSAHKELSARGYPSKSVLNWRPPLLAVLLGNLANIESGRLIVSGLAVAALLLWVQYFARKGDLLLTIFCGAIVGIPLLLPTVGINYLLHECWAGTLIALSLAGFANRRMAVCFIAGFASLLIRETTLIYILTMLFCAIKDRQIREVRIWFGVIAAFFLMMIFHAMSVANIISEADHSGPGWLAFGGYGFVLGTSLWNIWLNSLPQWLLASLMPTLVLGVTTRRGGVGLRICLTLVAYLCTFSVIGRPDNSYWGLMYAPLLSFGFLWGGAALADLLRKIWTPAERSRGGANG
jgi:hypothetical protein